METNFQRIADKMSASAQGITDVLMPMGSELPEFIGKLSPMGRFVAVGALWETGSLPAQELVEALLFEPENVRFATGATLEEAEANINAVTPEGADGTDFMTTPDGTTTVTDFGSLVRHDEPTEAEVEDEIYATATGLIEDFPEYTKEVVRMVTAVGLDWPRGSGDYQGSKPFDQMTEDERLVGLINVYATVADLANRESNAA